MTFPPKKKEFQQNRDVCVIRQDMAQSLPFGEMTDVFPSISTLRFSYIVAPAHSQDHNWKVIGSIK
jgi:hypothetical protein